MCALLITSTAVARGDSGWLMVTDAGMRIPMEHVGMLVVADNAMTFSVIRTVGEAVSGVTSVTFSYDPSSSGITAFFPMLCRRQLRLWAAGGVSLLCVTCRDVSIFRL